MLNARFWPLTVIGEGQPVSVATSGRMRAQTCQNRSLSTLARLRGYMLRINAAAHEETGLSTYGRPSSLVP